MKTHVIYKIGLLFSVLFVSISCKQDMTNNFMTISTNSEKALELYQNGYEIAFDVVELEKAVSYYEQAIKEDSNFFMAYYQLATFHLFHNNDEKFEENAIAGINCNTKLSKGEEIQKKALEEWLKDKNSNNSNLGLELLDLYPNDADAYINLGFYYYLNKDYDKAISAFLKADSTEVKDNYYCGPKLAIVPICMLGYAYLITDQLENAKSCFDHYIELFPDDQNPYDCKGDYFMQIKKYDKAYESYLKAYYFDTTFQMFYERALKAKLLYDSIINE